MADIIPAILPKDYEELKNHISLVRGAVSLVQVDICDGNFVKNISWPFRGKEFDPHFEKILAEEEGMPFWEDIEFELDLMVADAIGNFDIYTKLSPKSVVLHLEAAPGPEELRDFIEGIDPYMRENMKIGVAINTTTPVESISPLSHCVDFVQVMGIERIGFQGQEFDERCLDQVRALRRKFPDLVIAVDGAVDFETAPELVQAGASKLVIGSAIFTAGDILGAIEEFRKI